MELEAIVEAHAWDAGVTRHLLAFIAESLPMKWLKSQNAGPLRRLAAGWLDENRSAHARQPERAMPRDDEVLRLTGAAWGGRSRTLPEHGIDDLTRTLMEPDAG